MIKLLPHQLTAVSQMRTGSILCGGVGSGKSITALYYYYTVECNGKVDTGDGFTYMDNPKDLFIITTAHKRDTFDWERECLPFMLSTHRELNLFNVKVTVDSWNNISKYSSIKNAFFIFDEQRVIGSGPWTKSFLKITKNNHWILLSATPGDSWMDYIPVFIANGFYKNRSEFIRNHVVYNNFSKFPKVDHFIEISKLDRFKDKLMIYMDYEKKTIPHFNHIIVSYDKEKFNLVMAKRWNPFKNIPIKDVSEYYYTMRKVVNSDNSRIVALLSILKEHPRIIVFYNFNYELEILKMLSKENANYQIAEYNGHKHEPIPNSESWIYLVQYNAGSEGWNCIETNCIVFYSQNYSYRMMTQAAGRIDRLNTPFTDLYYYRLRSDSFIDNAILKAFKNKKNFNERKTFERIL